MTSMMSDAVEAQKHLSCGDFFSYCTVCQMVYALIFWTMKGICICFKKSVVFLFKFRFIDQSEVRKQILQLLKTPVFACVASSGTPEFAEG